MTQSHRDDRGVAHPVDSNAHDFPLVPRSQFPAPRSEFRVPCSAFPVQSEGAVKDSTSIRLCCDLCCSAFILIR